MIFIVIAILLLTLFTYIIYSFCVTKEQFTTKYPKGYTKVTADYIEPNVIENLISKEEADYIINFSQGKFKNSQMVGDFQDESYRKSETCWLSKNDKIAKGIINRICKMIGKKLENAEDLQIVRYKPNGMYRKHHDACCDKNKECTDFLKRGGQRTHTIVIYLTDDFEGGETKFPELNKSYKPKKYSGLLFHTMDVKNNTCHPKAIHEGTDVLKGVKLICNVWFREGIFV